MKSEGKVYYLFSDHLGSTTTVVERDTGRRISYQLYHPWGTTRYSSGAQATDYGYTGQMQVDDIYYYNARWYDPTLGRFMQADTIVPPHQGTQGFDRYAYVNNNPMIFTDPRGYWIENKNLMLHDGSGGNYSDTELRDLIINNLERRFGWQFNNNDWSLSEAKSIQEGAQNIKSYIDRRGYDGERFISTYLANVIFNVVSPCHLVFLISDLNATSEEMGAIAFVYPYDTINKRSDNYDYQWSNRSFIHEAGHILENFLAGHNAAITGGG